MAPTQGLSGRTVALGAYAQALRREAYNLERWPNITWQQVYNQLRRAAADTAGLESHISKLARADDPDAEPWFLDITPSADSPSLLRVLTGDRTRVSSARFSPDSARVLAGRASGSLELWDTEAGTLEAEFRGTASTISGTPAWCTDVAWSPDGLRVAVGSSVGDRAVRVWDARAGALVTEVGDVGDTIGLLSPDGSLVVGCGQYSYKPRVLDVATGELVCELEGHKGRVTGVAWVPNTTRLVTGSVDTTVRIWEARTGQTLRVSPATGADVYSVAVARDGRHIACGDKDGRVAIWDVEADTVVSSFDTEGTAVGQIAFSPDASRLVASSNRDLLVYDVTTGVRVALLRGHTGRVGTIDWSGDGRHIVSGAIDGVLMLWDALDLRGGAAAEGHGDLVTDVAWAPDGARIVSASADWTLRLWTPDGVPTGAVARGSDREVNGVAWSPDSTRFVSASEDEMVKIWDADSVAVTDVVSGGFGYLDYPNPANCVAWSPDGLRIAYGRDDHTPRIADAAGGHHERVLHGHNQGILAVAWSPDGSQLASGSADATIRLWRDVDGSELATLRGHTSKVTALAWRPDGLKLASGSADGTIRIWSPPATEGELVILTGAPGVTSVAWSPCGSCLFAGTRGGVIQAWDMAAPDKPIALRPHLNDVYACDVSPPGDALCYGGMGGSVFVLHLAGRWPLSMGTALTDAASALTRCSHCAAPVESTAPWCPRCGWDLA